MATALHTTILDDGTFDGFQYVWNLWWVRHAVARGESPFFTPLLFAPAGVTLFWHTLGATIGLASLPLGWLGGGMSGAVWVHDVVNLAAVPLTVCAMVWLVGGETGRPWLGVAAGVALVATPFSVRQLHIAYLSSVWLLIGVLAAWRSLHRRRGRWRAVATAGGVVALFFACPDYAAMAVVLLTLDLAVGWAAGGPRWSAGGVAVLAGALVAIGLAALAWGGGAAPPPPTLAMSVANSAWLVGFVSPPWATSPPGWLYTARLVYLGVAPLVLLLVAQVAAPRAAAPWTVGALACLAVSLGPLLQWGPPPADILLPGVEHPAVWPGWSTPYHLAWRWIPGVAVLRAPWRWVAAARVCAVVAGAHGLAALGRRLPRAVVVAATALLLGAAIAEAWPHRLRVVDAVAPRGYAAVTTDEPVLDLPSGVRLGTLGLFSSIYMAYQTDHGRPLVDGTVARVPPGYVHVYDWPDVRLAAHPEIRWVVVHRRLFHGAYPPGPSLRLARQARRRGTLVHRDREVRVYRLG